MFKMIGDFLGGLWRYSNRWRVPPFEDAGAGIRVGSPLGGGLMFLFLLLAIIAIVLVVVGSFFGFTAEETLGGVDTWLGRIGPAMDTGGQIAIKIILGIVLLFCVIGGLALLNDRFGRVSGERPGWTKTILSLLLCLAVGYCSAVNIAAPFDPYNPSVGSRYMD